MPRVEINARTISEVDAASGDFIINCFTDLNDDGTTKPAIYKSDVLQNEKIIDNTSGKEGELIMSYNGDTVGEINEHGELIIEPDGDDVDKYQKQNENLIYNE